MNIAKIIDEHRIVSTAFGTTREGRNGRWATCLCGIEFTSFYDEQSAPVDEEDNPARNVQRKHAAHVEEVLQEALKAEKPTVERVSPLGTPGITYRAVERTTATKYQVQAIGRSFPELMAEDLLKRAAHEIGRHVDIPTQIKIDRAPVGQGEKITVTWFA